MTALWAGQDTVHGSILSPRVRGELELEGIGNLLALTKSHEVNALAVERLRHSFGRSNTWQLPAEAEDHAEGRAHGWPDDAPIEQRHSAGGRIRGNRVREPIAFHRYPATTPGT